jgi:hypothetical integral membrane protein (TIGR02206 family)
MYFQQFRAAHLLILGAIPLGAAGLARLGKRSPRALSRIRIALGLLIGINELVWYGYVLAQGWVVFPYGLPLDLCDVVLWLTVFTLFTLKQWSFDLIYYWGLIGTGMAVVTPDIGASFPSYIAIKFLFAHGAVVTAILFLVWSRLARPRKDSWWKALLWVDAYAAVIGAFNLVFHANYFYLCRKPASGSLLDYFGPWPWYLISGEIVAVALFFGLWLPFRSHKS